MEAGGEAAGRGPGRVDTDSTAGSSCPHSAEVAVDRRHAAGARPEDSAAGAASGGGPDVIKDARLRGDHSETDETPEACWTPCGQDYYLRRGGTPRRRSALRLSRIIARQQLLQRLLRGRDAAFCDIIARLVGGRPASSASDQRSHKNP